MSTAALNWWGCQDKLENQVKALLPGDWQVAYAPSLQSILDFAQADRTVFLVPQGTPGVSSEGRGKVAEVSQRWTIVFAVQMANDPTGKAHRERVAPIIHPVLTGLMGAFIGEGWAPWSLAAPPGADLITDSFAYFPFSVETSIRLTASNPKG
jgi:hypothetical protein